MPGPYVTMATFCEKVLQEADGVISVIRAVDRFTLSAQGAGAPAELPEGGAISLNLVVTLKADDARGRHPITIRAHLPSGGTLPDQTVDVMFEGDDRGVNLITELAIQVEEGLYWFEIYINDRLLTRVPLRIIYQRIQTGG